MAAGGIAEPFADVFRDDDLEVYREHFARTSSGTEPSEAKVRTYVPSSGAPGRCRDHSPLWVEIRTDFTDEYLRPIAGR